MTIFEWAPPALRAIRLRRISRLIATLALATAGLGHHSAAGEDAADPVAIQRDTAARFSAGDYAGVIEATEGIEKVLRAKSKDPDFVPRMRLLAELLTRRAVAERRLGRLDAAEASLEAAAKTLGDRDLQRLVAMFMRSAGDKAVPAVVSLELTNLELVDARLELVLSLIEAELEAEAQTQGASDDEMRAGASVQPPAGDSESPPMPEPVRRKTKARGDLRQTFNALLYQSRGLRQGLAERLEKADPAVRGSPTFRALVSLSRPTLHGARAALIVARTPPTGGEASIHKPQQGAVVAAPTAVAPPPATADLAAPGTSPVDPAAIPDPVALLTEALDAADVAMAPALQPSQDDNRPVAEAEASLERARSEAALVRAPCLEWRARANILAGDATGARADIQAALAERVAAGQRAHPDVVEALVIGGEAALAEAEQTKVTGDLAGSRGAFEHAVAWLSRAREVAAACPGGIDADSPLRQRIETLLDNAVESRQNTASTVATTDAVDAAAGRALRALRKRPAATALPTAAVASP